jgi:uncharacterized protein YfaS (alpha-2-macroglobulin family)
MSSHEHVADLVDDFVHELLGPRESARVEDHCARCPACAAALGQARRRLALLRGVPPCEPPAGLVPDTLGRIESARRGRRVLLRRVAPAVGAGLAAAALLLVTANVYYANLRPTPFDLVVLGQTRLFPGTPASFRVRLTDRRAPGNPVSGAPVVLALEAADGRRQELGRFTTDAQGSGSPRFTTPDWADGRYQLCVTADAPGGDEVLRRPVQLARSWRLMLSTDKPVYQPGQTILARALALRRPDLLPAAGQPVVFTLTDPRGNVLFKHRAKASAFGISSAECPLDQEIQEGAYLLAAQVGETESRTTLDVRRYVLPKFRLDVHPDRPYYAPGETARVTVQADYFFGKAVRGGAVTVEMRTTDVGERVVQTQTGKTDDHGRAVLSFTVPPALVGRGPHGDAQVRFLATLADGAGQTQTRSAGRTVTRQPVRIEAVPEAGVLVRGVANTVYLLLSRADGTPLANVSVVVRGGAEAVVRTDDRGAASFTVTPRLSEVRLAMQAIAAGGAVLAGREARLTCGQAVDDFLLRTDRAVYRAGQTVTLTALGGGAEPVFVDFLKDGQTLLSETVALAHGAGKHAFDLPPGLSGTLLLVAYRFRTDGSAVRKVRVLYVRPAGGLKIDARLDRAEYRPGREATLRVALTDAAGKPTPGAVSLAAVDEAVFSVLAQRPGTEQTFFNLEQELLRPVYALYPWSPEEGPGADQRDRALFAATAHEGDQQAHTLAGDSYREKEQYLGRLRTRRLDLIRRGWAALVLTVLAGVYGSLWVFLTPGTVLRVHAIAAVVLFLIGVGGLGTLMLLEPPHKQAFSLDKETVAMRATPGLAEPAPQGQVGGKEGPTGSPRVRQHFPETLLWKPELVTDDQGRLPPVTVRLADSITTWRLAASAVAADGRLGAVRLPLKVFQPFFVDLDLPVSLTRGDEAGVAVVVYNYLPRPQAVTLTVARPDWFDLSGKDVRTLELAANEVRSLRLTLRVKRVGNHKLRVAAVAGGVSDAVERAIDVVPDGRPVETAHGGSLDRPAAVELDVPPTAVEGSVKAFVKLYPSSFSQVVEGLDSIFRMPSGCFEQTSSTTYPNVLALDYLRRTKKTAPAVEGKARQYIHLGYQRLVGFEVPGGGFDWFGRPPANRTLTAYGLMEFADMAKVHDVDARLISRTRDWLLARRDPDGSWAPEEPLMHENVARGDPAQARLATTAYIAWAVFADGAASASARPTLDYLLRQPPGDFKDPHVLALVCNALAAVDPANDALGTYRNRLADLRKSQAGGRFCWWEQPAGARTTFYGGGASARIETTALAALALLQGKRHPGVVRGALAWLVAQKDPRGAWDSTQATVLTLRALLAGAGGPAEEGARRFVVRVGGHTEKVSIPADQAEVMKVLDVSKHLRPGRNVVELRETTRTAAAWQVVFRYHTPEPKGPEKESPLTVEVAYDRTELALGDVVKAKATVVNRMQTDAPMVMLDLPVPPGFVAQAEEFEQLVRSGTIARFQVRPRQVLVYLRGLQPGRPLALPYTLRATMPVKAAGAGARVYEYYDPQKQGRSRAVRFTVR